MGQQRTLFKFEQPDAVKTWQTVNDGVMGGRSSGKFLINDSKNLEFYGALSLENNGGFASVRASGKNLALNANESVFIRVRGDGRKYSFNLYAGQNLGGYSYRQNFQTKKDEWIVVQMPVSQFVATWRGRTFPNQKLIPAQVSGVGILLGDKRSGKFKLEVDWIKAGKSLD